MASLNEMLRDETLAHIIDLQRYANHEVREILRILNSADSDLLARLRAALERLDISQFTVQRLAAQLTGVWELNEQVYRQMNAKHTGDSLQLTRYEVEHQERLFDSLLPRQLQGRFGIVAPDQVYAAAMAEPFRGKLLHEWYDALGTNRQNRINDSLRVGYVSGKTVDEMIRDLRGTKANNYEDGIIQIDRQHAEAVVRTATSHTASFAREAFYEANDDLIEEEQWVSTLDNRTTPMCQIRDGLIYTTGDHDPVDHKVPWLEGPGALHWQCRSTSVPVIKAWDEIGLDLPEVERASMNGVAAPGTTYSSWLKRQSAERQDEILGPTRGALLRRGGLTLERFFNDKGVYLTLDELRDKDAVAFKKAKLP